MNKNRALSLLNVIMNWPQFNGKSSFLSQGKCLLWVWQVGYEASLAVLLRSVTGLKVWLQLQIDDSYGYDKSLFFHVSVALLGGLSRWLGSSMTSTDTGRMEATVAKTSRSLIRRKRPIFLWRQRKRKRQAFKVWWFQRTWLKGSWEVARLFSKEKGHGQSKGRGDGGKGGQWAIQCWHGRGKSQSCKLLEEQSRATSFWWTGYTAQ